MSEETKVPDRLIQKLRTFPMFFLNGHSWMRGCDKEPLCIEAADEIERLRNALQEAADSLWNYSLNGAARKAEASVYPPSAKVMDK